MKITLEIDAEMDELEPLVRMILMGQVTEADVIKAQNREAAYKIAEKNARVSKLFLDAEQAQNTGKKR